jgi:extracellular matrix protein 14
MNSVYKTLSLLPFLVLVLCATTQAFAVPWRTEHSAHYSASHQPSEAKLRSVFPQLTWLRDTAIEKVFGLPSKSTNAGVEKPSFASHSSSSQLPATLLAKYGGDVVLRFNLSTSHEELALAEAADTLFLDVWEFTSNWADVRLREDDVSSGPSPA